MSQCWTLAHKVITAQRLILSLVTTIARYTLEMQHSCDKATFACMYVTCHYGAVLDYYLVDDPALFWLLCWHQQCADKWPEPFDPEQSKQFTK